MTESPKTIRARVPFSDEEIKTLNAAITDDELITPDHLYFDWSLFRDVYLGAAITLLMSEPDQDLAAKKFDHIQTKLKAYQEREFNDVAHYFPELRVTADVVAARLADSDKQAEIFFAAPFTVFIQTLRANLAVNVNHSQVKEKFTKVSLGRDRYRRNYDAIRLTINTYPLKLGKAQHDMIGIFFTRNFGVDVEIINHAPQEIPLDLLLRMDEIYTNHLTLLLDNPDFSQALTDLKFLKTHLFAAKHLGPKRPVRINPRAIEAEFFRMKTTLSVLIKFAWLDPRMLTYDLRVPDPPPAH